MAWAATQAERRVPRATFTGRNEGRLDGFFTGFSSWVARWTGSHWTFTVAGVLLIASLVLFGVETTNIAISIVFLLMVFVLQNTQNRDSAALHLKLDEIVQAEPDARDDVAGSSRCPSPRSGSFP
jgi:low affinity Fe/Cu permease